jgi:hypothetical protein
MGEGPLKGLPANDELMLGSKTAQWAGGRVSTPGVGNGVPTFAAFATGPLPLVDVPLSL